MGAFHAYDIRGIYNVDFDKDTAWKVGYFIPELLNTKRVLVGRDCRVSSDEVHDALLDGLNTAGADVYDIGLSTTPMVYFATASYGFKASVQITASHNPKEYNGMKVSREDALPVGLESGLGQIRDWIAEGRETPAAPERGKVHKMDIQEDYLKFLMKYKGDYSNLKIAFDLSNGMSTLLAKSVFGDDGVYLYDEMDGSFPNHEPNPLVESNVVDLEKLVVREGADIGVIFDGDADRVMFVDNLGRFVPPDLIIALLGEYFAGERGETGIVLQDIRSSKAVAEYLKPMGQSVHTWKVGRANAAIKLRELDGLWGGELAGHYYFKDFFYSDSGILAALLVLRVLARLKKKGLSMSQLIANIERYENSGEINYRVEDKAGAMEELKRNFINKENPSMVMDFDGYRVEFPDWWFNIRPSNTEPYLRFICEARTKEMLAEKIAEVDGILKSKFGATR